MNADHEHEAALARREAAVFLGKALAADPDLRWAYAEAARIAAGPPPRRKSGQKLRRLIASPALAWSVAGIASIVAVVSLMSGAPPREIEGGRGAPESSVGRRAAEPGVGNGGAGESGAVLAIAADSGDKGVPASPVVVLPGRIVVDANSLAVMPFELDSGPDVAGGPAKEDGGPRARAFASELYDAVVQRLEAIPGLYVAQRASVLPYAGTDLGADQVASQLGVRGIVEGRVATRAGQVRITLSLRDAANDDVMWQSTVERSADALGGVGAVVAADLASVLASADEPAGRMANR